MNVHLRFTPYDISGYSFDWLNQYSKHVVAYEDKDKDGSPAEPHFHIYIENVTESDSSLRNAIKSNFKIPKTTRGKGNKYYGMEPEWKDPDYIFKYGDLRQTSGYSEKEVMDRVVSGKKKYIDKVKPSVQGDTLIYEVASSKVKRVDLNKEIIADLLTWYMLESKNRDVLVKEIVSQACKLVRAHGRGINPFQIRDFVNAVLYEDEAKRDILLEKICKTIV